MSSLFSTLQPLAAIATTVAAAQRLQPLWESGKAVLYIPESILSQVLSTDRQDASQPLPSGIHSSIKSYSGPLRQHLAELWPSHSGFVLHLASGAAVRLIAPLLQHKTADPAVVVVSADYAISLCSGHQGGADELAIGIARLLNLTPVLTGGANELGLPGIDRLGTPFGWRRGRGDWTSVSAAVARQEPVQVVQHAGAALWKAQLPPQHPFEFEVDSPTQSIPHTIYITAENSSPDLEQSAVYWHPRVLWVGVGCERNTPTGVIAAAIQQIFAAHNLSEAAVAGIATLDLKADEAGILELCRDRNWALRCFPAEMLRSIPVPTPSSTVAAEVGTPSVAEAAALVASAAPGADPALSKLLVSKQIFRQPDQPGAVTIAVAQAEREYIGHGGKLWLVGIGPGQLDQITPAAQTAIAQADVVIGYGLYVDLIRPLLRSGQIVEALPITQEKQRAERAIDLAQWGLTVAVISSGDCGIYGMAGLVLEQLRTQDWDGKAPAVQVFPGITALQAAASRVGAPLMHDFCAISLSDLLTPWAVIEQRLKAAAQADFVTALYNPRSQTRVHQIEQAQTIFLQHRSPDTPVAIVRSAYRPDEQIILSTLERFLEVPIDMLTLVLIGNQSSRTHADWMITPRGYLGFS